MTTSECVCVCLCVVCVFMWGVCVVCLCVCVVCVCLCVVCVFVCVWGGFIEGVGKESKLGFSFRSSKHVQHFLLFTLTDQLARLPNLRNEQLQLSIYSNLSFRFCVRIRLKCMKWLAKWLRRLCSFSGMSAKKFSQKKKCQLASPSQIIYLSDRNDT